MKSMLDMYLQTMKQAIIGQFQYRVANYFYMIGMITEPVVYLVVWSTVARQQGGAVGGYTPGQFAAYYIVWTLVRNMNIALTPYAWEYQIREGRLNAALVRPVHPIHFDLAYFSGWKFVVIAMWLPIAAILTLAFQPTFNLTWWSVPIFLLAIWGGFLVRFFFLWALGMITFWTTRVSAIFELYFTLELLLSGRFVPLALLPDWAQQLAGVLPFKWAFGYPIEVLAGQQTLETALTGLAMQGLWVIVGILVSRVAWRFAIRAYSAVGA